MRDQLIRFRPRGCKGYPFFEIVLIKKHKKARGKYIERLGFLNPNSRERCLVLDIPRLGFWLNKGAKIRLSVKKCLVKMI
jgi:small subunit ribosomal protein S16